MDQIDEFKKAFTTFVKGGDDTIPTTVLREVMSSLQLFPYEEELVFWLSRNGYDGNGKINLREFVDMMEASIDFENDEIFVACKELDKEGRGRIHVTDFLQKVVQNEWHLSDEKHDQMAEAANRNGLIDYEDIVIMRQPKR